MHDQYYLFVWNVIGMLSVSKSTSLKGRLPGHALVVGMIDSYKRIRGVTVSTTSARGTRGQQERDDSAA